MKYSVSVSVTDNSGKWLAESLEKTQEALLRMAKATVAGAKMTVPKKTGVLALSGKASLEGSDSAVARFGDSDVRYAAVQEVGMRKGVKFTHYTTPGTGPRYLKKAGDAVAKKGIKPYL